jgi:hypothetical protein
MEGGDASSSQQRRACRRGCRHPTTVVVVVVVDTVGAELSTIDPNDGREQQQPAARLTMVFRYHADLR